MSAFIKPVELSGRALKLRVYRGDGSTEAITYNEIADVNGTLGSANYASFTADNEGWYRMTYTFIAPVGVTFVKPTLHLYGTGSVGNKLYVDGAQFEEGSVVRSWTPGFVTQAVTYEGAGIAVDASKGGNLRLRAKGSTAGSPTTRDVIEIGANGLDFGGGSPASLYSGSASTLNVTGDLTVSGAVRTAGNNLDPAVYIGDDALIFDADTADTLGIQGQQTAANGAIVFGSGKDTNLYRGGANILKTDDALWVAGHDFGTGSTIYDKAGSADTTTITAALSYNALTNAEVTFTPQFVGQRWLFTFTGYVSLNTTVVQYAFVRCSITDSSSNIITSPTNYTSWAFTRSDNFGSSGRGSAVGITKIWVADTTSARKFKLYGTTQTTSGLVLSLAYTQMSAIPLG
jgi:hypothetical protein